MQKHVAIIGQAFRFPGTSTAEYWNDLLSSKDLITTVDPTRWDLNSFSHPGKTHPGTAYTFAAGSIGDVTQFDAAFFGISPREASLMDPQQRLLLELCWETLENAGVKASSIAGSRCGVFIGIASSDYSFRMADDLGAIDASTATGNTASIAANRLSYVLDLRGPSMAIDTACSSSLVAFHQACQSIRCGESTQAIAGGVSLHLHPYGFIVFSKATMLSRRGQCNVFDADADGYVRSEGGGLFLLKDYDQAVIDGDRILAIVANSAVNTDGKKSGLTIPSHGAQAALLEEAYAAAGISAAEIDYMEAHGTGTAVGDPIETRALSEALARHRDRDKPLLIGSIKSNLGHLEAASGVAGLVKAIYSIQNRVVPATIGIKKTNPNIPFDEWNLAIATQTTKLKQTGKLIIGCNSFGFGGANAHVILQSPEETTESARISPRNVVLPLVISGKDEAALKAAARNLSDFLAPLSVAALYDVAYHAAFRRDWHAHRAVIFGSTRLAFKDQLRKFSEGAGEASEVVSGVALDAASGPAFIYTGNGSQWAGMGAQLLSDPIFKKAILEVEELFSEYADFSLQAEFKTENGKDRYALTEIAQPALFALQVGITRMLQHKGIEPVAVAGHSVGEVAAAWVAGALSLADAVKVIYYRSLLQGTTRGNGGMTAVSLGAPAAQALLEECRLTEQISVAGINSANGVTIAGAKAALSQVEAALSERRIDYKRLDLDYAFHSVAMDAIESGVKDALLNIRPQIAQIPFYSTVTGQLLTGIELDAEYWWHNIRKPVMFESAVREIQALGTNVFVEIGPHPILRGYLNDSLKMGGVTGRVIPTIKRGDDLPQRIWDACGQVMISGVAVDLSAAFPWQGEFVDLPHYAWQRETCWHPVTPESTGLLYRANVHPLLGYAVRQDTPAWESVLDTHKQPVLADHVVGKATVFPGTGFVELALAAASLWHPSACVEIEDLEIRSPLLLSKDQSKLVRFDLASEDGSFTVVGRNQGSDEAGVLHAVGRILGQATDILLMQDSFQVPTRQIDFTAQSHEHLTIAAGLGYGPAFRAIDHGWIDQNSVSAAFRIPAEIAGEIGQYHLHPALLDCAFQLIIQLLKDDVAMHEGMTFVPTAVGRIALRANNAVPHFARVVLLNRAPHSLSADVSVFAEDGQAIAVLKSVRFRSIRLQRNDADHVRFLDYRWVPNPVVSSFSPGLFENLQTDLGQALHDGIGRGEYIRFSEEIDPLLDGLASRFSLAALSHINQQHQVANAARVTVAPFAAHLLSIAREDGLVDATASGDHVPLKQEDDVSAEDIWNSLVADYPDYFHLIHAVGRVGMHLPSLLGGTVELEHVLPQQATFASLSQQVLGPNGRAVVAKTLAGIVERALRDLAEGSRFKVLEISEGQPSFAGDFCHMLDFDRSDYTFASTSAASLEEVERLRERFPALDTHQFGDAVAQAADARQNTKQDACEDVVQDRQLVVLMLDFLNVHDALRALQYARERLVENGSLLVLSQHSSRWLDFVFGHSPVWWSASDSGTLLSRQQPVSYWQEQLAQHGFSHASLLEFSPETNCGAYMLIAQGAGKLAHLPIDQKPVRHWLVLADAHRGPSSDLAQSLSEKLSQLGDRVTVSAATEVSELTQLLTSLGTSGRIPEGVLYLGGMDAYASSDARVILQQQVHRCATTAALIQACEKSQTNTTCWIITSQGAPDVGRSHSAKGSGTSASIADAALWGFTRTLMNEASDFSIRMIDLHEPRALDTAVGALLAELNKPDQEQEVVITASGARLVPRLQVRERPDTRPATSRKPDECAMRLGFQIPGQLRNLRWEEHAYTAPKDDELEVEVHATGLNFRDVMYALGLLSDEAVENGFAGPTLGLEFSGVVKRAGKLTTGYAPGDLVVGFGPSSFSDRVTTKVNAIAHIPAGMSFEAAATIPSTFFTVYYAFHHLARLSEGEKVLIHGAAGGVGIAAIQMAQWCGAEIYATAGSDEKRDFLRMLGVKHIFNSRSLSFSDEILQATGGKGVDVVLNSLAGEAINRNFRVLKPFGRYLELGKRDFYENTKIGLRPFRNNISYFGIDADQLMSERPDLTHRLFGQMMGLFNKNILHPLPYQRFEADQIVDAFRHMQQAKQIGKVVITYRKGITPAHASNANRPRQLALSAEGSYLITGGLSGFGLKTAERLAANGARQLVLISRSGPASEEARAAISRLTHAGVQVVARSCDVTDKQALSGLLVELAATVAPIKGIVHAAMVIDDGLIRNTDAGQIERVLAPKILGAQYLHELTQSLALDFFVLFSSATTLFGNPGQGNYVAANSWLEALAKQRRALGLPATCVRWGAIDDAGFLARNEKIKEVLQSRMGGAALHSSAALDALEALILTDRSGEAVLEVDWKALSKFLPSAGSPKFSELARQAGGSDVDDDRSDDIQKMLMELSDEELIVNFSDMLRHEVGEILRVSPDKIDPSRSIYDMGLDSLMGVELVVALESRFGIRLPVMALSESQTILKLAERILVLLRGAGEKIESATAPTLMQEQIQQVVALHAADVSAETVAELAEEITAGYQAKQNRMIH